MSSFSVKSRSEYDYLMQQAMITPEEYMRKYTGLSDATLGKKALTMNMVFGSLKIVDDVVSLYGHFAKLRCDGTTYLIEEPTGSIEERFVMYGGLATEPPTELSSYSVRKTAIDLEPIKFVSDFRGEPIPLWADTFKELMIRKILNTAPVNGLNPKEELKQIDLQNFTTDIYSQGVDIGNTAEFLNFKLNQYMNIGVFLPNLDNIKVIENTKKQLIGLHIPEKMMYTTTYRCYLLEQEANHKMRYSTRGW